MSNDMKRVTAPRSWPIPRKTTVWITSTAPGAHKKDWSMPIMIVIRDMLGLCDNASEGKRILSGRDVLVDGKVVTDPKFPVGLMDIISIPKINQHYRMLLDRNGKLRLVSVTEGREKWKLCRIDGKTTIKGGKTQLNLHDGRCILVEKDSFHCGDVVKLEMPTQKILETFKFGKGSVALIVSGVHAGEIGVIEEYVITRSSAPNLVRMKDGMLTIRDNVFVIGTKAPEITLPEAS
jgi:small subunit ribosomal protein S4e